MQYVLLIMCDRSADFQPWWFSASVLFYTHKIETSTAYANTDGSNDSYTQNGTKVNAVQPSVALSVTSYTFTEIFNLRRIRI